jgi:hypothetical protein
MRKITSVAAVVALAVLAPAGAQAAAPWAAPTAFGTPADYVQSPHIAFAANGNGLAGWDGVTSPAGGGVLVQPPAGNDGIAGSVLRLTQGDGFGELRTLPDTLVAGPELAADGRGLVLRSTISGADPNGNRKTRVTWSNVDAAGALGTPHALFAATLTDAPTLAVDARGDALVGWTEYAPPKSKRRLWGSLTLKAAWRPAGSKSFNKPRTLFVTQSLDYDHSGQVAVTLNASGRALIAYGDAHDTHHGTSTKVYAWAAPRAGAAFGPTLTAGTHQGVVRTAAALDARGRATVVWGSQDGGEEANKPYTVQAASLAPGSRKFGAAQTLDDGSGAIERSMGTLALAIDGGGRVVAAWSGVRRDPSAKFGIVFPVQSATSDPATGRFGAVQQLAPDGAVGGVATRPQDGAAVVTWAHVVQYQMTDEAMAALRPAGAAAFGAPEALAEPDDAQPPTVAFNPASGAPVAAWSARPGGHDPFYGLQRDAVLRVASRAAP